AACADMEVTLSTLTSRLTNTTAIVTSGFHLDGAPSHVRLERNGQLASDDAGAKPKNRLRERAIAKRERELIGTDFLVHEHPERCGRVAAERATRLELIPLWRCETRVFQEEGKSTRTEGLPLRTVLDDVNEVNRRGICHTTRNEVVDGDKFRASSSREHSGALAERRILVCKDDQLPECRRPSGGAGECRSLLFGFGDERLRRERRLRSRGLGQRGGGRGPRRHFRYACDRRRCGACKRRCRSRPDTRPRASGNFSLVDHARGDPALDGHRCRLDQARSSEAAG